MNKSFHKDIWRSIRNDWKRFLSILVIMILGVGMFTGLHASSMDMYYSANHYFDEQNLFDIRILSTMGLTQEDVLALDLLEEIELVEGGYSENVYTNVDEVRKKAEVRSLSQKGLNMPYVLAGTLPEKINEIAVSQKYLDESGKSLGDRLTIDLENDEAESDGLSLLLDEDNDLYSDLNLSIEESQETINTSSFTITAAVLDPMDIQSHGNGSNFRSTGITDYTFFVTDKAINTDYYTAIYITLTETKNLDSYTDQYESLLNSFIQEINQHVKSGQEQARDDSIYLDAESKINDIKQTLDEKFDETDILLSDAKNDIAKGNEDLIDAEAELAIEEANAEDKFDEAWLEIETAKDNLLLAEEELTAGENDLLIKEAELYNSKLQVDQGKLQLESEWIETESQFSIGESQISDGQMQIEEQLETIESELTQLKTIFADSWPENEWNLYVNAVSDYAASGLDELSIVELTEAERNLLLSKILIADEEIIEAVTQTAFGMGILNGKQKILEVQTNTLSEQKEAAFIMLNQAKVELNENENQLNSALELIQVSKSEIESAKIELNKGKAELLENESVLENEETDAYKKIAEAKDEIALAKSELIDAESKLTKEENEYLDTKKEVEEELSDAYTDLENIDKIKWYIQDRTSLESYASLDSDLSSIKAIGRLFPLLFLLIAILMSSTTMTRMVEEERGLIGTYKSLGFSNQAIYLKYLIFAFLACLLGGILGDLFGYIFFPRFIMTILEELYNLPHYYLRFDTLYGVGGILLFMIAILGATYLACRKELKQTPAKLMRPKVPRAGSRIFLEGIPIFWNRLKFLNKVTIRNLFRYKKRLFMTIGGIIGCTSLILCGFGIKDSVAVLASEQYENIIQYDLMAVFDENDQAQLSKKAEDDQNIKDYLNLRIDSVKLINSEGKSENVQLFVIPKDHSIDSYINLLDLDGESVNLDSEGAIVTVNAAKVLNFKSKDNLILQNAENLQYEITVSAIVENYLGNYVYMSQEYYESVIGEYAPSGIIATLSEECTDHSSYRKELSENDAILSVMSSTELKEEFEFELIDAIVLLLIIMAGGLAFVVLFTLSNTNISERIREIATIKVLGFYDKEVYQYINKENIILTIIGILIGLPAGYFLTDLLFKTLNMPAIHFRVNIFPESYIFSALITFSFAIIVNFLMNRTLDRINMVDALKSVE